MRIYFSVQDFFCRRLCAEQPGETAISPGCSALSAPRTSPKGSKGGGNTLTPPTRESWDDYFMKLTRLVASRSTCLRRQIGALLVREHRLLATGYNGAPSGLPHCLDVGCLRQQKKIPSGERSELCRAVHAEQNVLLQCARFGLSTEGATLYCTHFPCSHCAKSLLSAKVCRILYGEDYRDELAKELLTQAREAITVEAWKPSAGAKSSAEIFSD